MMLFSNLFVLVSGQTFKNNSLKSYVLCFISLYGNHIANLLSENYEDIIISFGNGTKLVRLVTDNALNNIKAFQHLVISRFESYFEDGNNFDEISVPCADDDHENMFDITKTSFDNITADNDANITVGGKRWLETCLFNSTSMSEVLLID